MAQKTSRQQFEAVFPQLEAVLLQHAQKYKLPAKELAWLKEVITANSLGGKYNRGISVHDTASLLLGAPLSDEQYLQASALGWMTELLQAFFLVADDMMDGSLTRRGYPCWYRREGVGLIAINDAMLLESCIYTLLRHFFRSHPAYVHLIELFHETTYQTELGQLCDLLTAPEDRPNLAEFSLPKHSFIVIYKTAYYSFYLPVALALHMLGLATPANLAQAERILIPLGEYFQSQDDFLDNYGDPAHIGKIGTDITDNKCSWLVCQALEIVTPEQRTLLEQNYGHKDPACEAAVKRLYDQLDLRARFEQFEERRAAEIRVMIDSVDESEGLTKTVFRTFLEKIYKRSK